MMPRQQPAASPRRAAYLDAARRVLSASGRNAVTLRSIAREAGVTAAALYRHFDDLDALVAELSADLWDRLTAELRAADEAAREAGALPRERLIAILDAYVTFSARQPHYYELLFTRQPAGRYVQGATTPTRPVYLVIEDALKACRDSGARMRVTLPARGDLKQGQDPDAILLFSVAHGRVALAEASQVVPFSDPESSREFVRDLVQQLIIDGDAE